MNPEQPLSQNPGVARSRPVTVLFLLALVLVPIGQATWELRRGEDVHALEADALCALLLKSAPDAAAAGVAF